MGEGVAQLVTEDILRGERGESEMLLGCFWSGVHGGLSTEMGTAGAAGRTKVKDWCQAQTRSLSVELVFKTRVKSGACEAVCGLVGGTQRHLSGVGMLSSSSQVTPSRLCKHAPASPPFGPAISSAPWPPERIKPLSPSSISPGLSPGHVTCDAE